MARGWKCPRCETQNGEGVMNCAKCGLIQGGVYVPSAYVPPVEEAADTHAATGPEAASGAEIPAPASGGVGFAALPSSSAAGQPVSGWVPPYPVAPAASRPLWRGLPLGLLVFGVLV